jgi:hypothetical protein
MSDNLRHWAVLGKTDPAQTKSFQRAGGFRGTAIRPIWNERLLTEHFGPNGIGWGSDKPEFTLVPAGDELLVYCTLSCWYRDGEATATVWGIGGDKVRAIFRNGPVNDDEAFKKAFTDALGNAFKHVGLNADVHMGMFEDSKYVAETRRDFADESPAQPAAPRSADDRAASRVAPDGGENRGASPDDSDLAIARATFRRIKSVIVAQKLPEAIDQVLDLNKADMLFLAGVAKPGHEELLSLAAARKTELRASA